MSNDSHTEIMADLVVVDGHMTRSKAQFLIRAKNRR